jgi:hypothetical protein
MNWQSELKEIEDRLFPHFQCNIWERGLYYYLLRRTHLIGEVEQTITLSEMSVALRCSDFQSRKTIRSLAQKGCIELEQTRNGHRVRVFLPNELDLPTATPKQEPIDIEHITFTLNENMWMLSSPESPVGVSIACARLQSNHVNLITSYPS